jgi:tRNA threonylcarbamoyladenosine biosynthesis protein TsaE
MNIFTSHSLEETSDFAQKWLTEITSLYPNLNTALVVGLSGHLGAGKTAYVKAVAKILGITEDITSPTFVIMKNYDITHGPWKKLVHIDAYRLEKKEELTALQWETVIADPQNLILIEWPENVGLTEFKPSADILFEIKEGVHHIEVK